jgi:hypothetical protein
VSVERGQRLAAIVLPERTDMQEETSVARNRAGEVRTQLGQVVPTLAATASRPSPRNSSVSDTPSMAPTRPGQATLALASTPKALSQNGWSEITASDTDQKELT